MIAATAIVLILVGVGVATWAIRNSAPPSSTHDLGIVDVTANPSTVTRGDIVNVTASVGNQGTVSETTSLTVRAGTVVAGSAVVSVAAGQTRNVTVSWNTASLAAGKYAILAEILAVAGEADVADNVRAGGNVTVLPRSLGATIWRTSDGMNWTVEFVAVPPGGVSTSATLTILNAAGGTALAPTAFHALSWTAHAALFAGDADAAVEVAERVLISVLTYASGHQIRIADSSGVLFSATLM